MWPAATTYKKFANKIGADVDIANTSVPKIMIICYTVP